MRKPTGERRQEIADAALRIIGERGLHHFTTAEVAREVGMTDGNLFRHFHDKREILTLAVEQMEQLVSSWGVPSDADPLKRLERFFHSRLEHALSQPGVQALAFSEQLSHAAGAEGARRVASIRQRTRDWIRSCLGEAAALGRLRRGLSPDELSLITFGAMQSLIMLQRDGSPRRRVNALVPKVWAALEAVISGVEPRGEVDGG